MKSASLRVVNFFKLDKWATIYRSHFYARAASNLLLLLLVWIVRFPHVFRKLYAEDGVTLLQGTYEVASFRDFLAPVGGFSQLVARIGAHFMRLFPIEYAAISAAMFTALSLAILSSFVFDYSSGILKRARYQFLLSIFFLFIPIANFNSVGTICNLYFYFMVAAGVILFSPNIENKKIQGKNLVILLATLTNPLCIFLLPLILGRIFLTSKGLPKAQITFSDVVWFAGMILQIVFIVLFSFGKRTPHPPSSILATIYLLLDRGIGSAVIPNWGFVSGSQANPNFENTLLMQSLLIRIVLSLVATVLISLLIAQNGKRLGLNAVTPSLFLLATALGFGLLIGVTFNVEPRYMIFSSFFVFYGTLVALSQRNSKFSEKLVFGWFVILILTSLSPSKYISEGPDWRTNLRNEVASCKTDPSKETTDIRIMPLNGWWSVKIKCSEFLDK
jgi:hypothetical protein